jgi:DNA helicase-2/ATP-dependent DNA helicase PcrA
MDDIVGDEQALLARVVGVLEEYPDVAAPREADIVAELLRLREELPKSKEEDRGALLDQYHQQVSLLDQLRASRSTARVDPESPYFAHLRLEEGGRERDVCLGKATKIEAGIRVIDWRNAPVSRLFYRYQQGDEYDEELGGRMVSGCVLARRTLVIRQARLERIDCPEGSFVVEEGLWRRDAREALRLSGGQGAALRAHGLGPVLQSHEGGAQRRLGTDYRGARHRVDKRLPDIAGLLDPEQFDLITRPSTGFVVIRGAAGSGKTTVALHRIAWLAFQSEEFDSARTLFMCFSQALCEYVAHVLPALGVRRAQVVAWRSWAYELRKRHFPKLPVTQRDDTPAVVSRLKVHPVVETALREQIRANPAAATVEQVVDDWISVLTDTERLSKIIDDVAPGLVSAAELRRATTWNRDRADELVRWLEGDRELSPELDAEDDALLIRAWQLRIGALRGKSGSAMRFRHVAIDEVQDLAPIEVRILLDCLDENRSITLAGDTQQHVMQESGFTSWTDFFRHLGVEGTTVDTLKISYRCTREIMLFSMALLGDLREDDDLPAVTKSGPPVELFRFTDHGAAVAFLAEALSELLHDEPLASVALLTPASDLSQLYFRGLAQAEVPRLRLVENQSFTFAPGVEVTEIEQVKGLEFDYVVLVEASSARFITSPASRRLLHVGATRAVHQLWVTAVGTPSGIVREAFDALGMPVSGR